MIKRILIPLDGSRFAKAAAPLARRLAGAANAELHLVLVQESLPAVSEETYQDLLDWARKGEERYLARYGDRLRPRDEMPEYHPARQPGRRNCRVCD